MAYQESVAFFLEQPSEFLDAAGVKSATPGKSRESFLETFAQHDSEAESLSCGLVQSLTHSEMQFIDEYADKLTHVGVSEEDAINLSVQLFAKGIDSAHKRLSLGPIVPEVEPEINAPPTASKFHPTHLRWDDAGNEVVLKEVLASQTEDMGFFGASLRKLFNEDSDEAPSTQEGEDIKLVMLYAAEVCLYGGIDPEVAHGVALDTFLDGPEEFRARVHISAPEESEIIVSETMNTDETIVDETIADEAIADEPASIRESKDEDEEDDDDLVEVEDDSPTEDAMELDNTAEEADLDALRSLLHDKVSQPRQTAATPRRAGRLLNTPATRVNATTAKPSASVRRAQRATLEEEDGNDFASHLLGQRALVANASADEAASLSATAVKFAETSVVVTIDTSAPVLDAVVESTQVSTSDLETTSSVSSKEKEVATTAMAAEVAVEASSEPLAVVVEEVVVPEVSKSAVKGKSKKEVPSKSANKAAPKPVVAEEVVEEEELEEIIVLFCDSCDKEVPLDETGLVAVPEGDWFCTKCTSKREKENAVKKGAKAPPTKAKKEIVQEKKAEKEEVEEEEEDLILLCDG